MWAVQSWQDERRGRPADERVGRNPAGREEVTEAEVALARFDRYGGGRSHREHGEQDRLHGCDRDLRKYADRDIRRERAFNDGNFCLTKQ